MPAAEENMAVRLLVQTGLQEAALLSLILAKKYEQAFLLTPPDSMHCLRANPVTNTQC